MKLAQRGRKIVHITPDALSRAGASSVLALDVGAIGGSVSMLAAAPTEEPAQDRVGLVRIEGALAQRAIDGLCAFVDGYDAITARLGAALVDKRTVGVLLVIDSPGGDVPGLEEAVRRMREAADASGKPVVAYVDELAASAAYWIAAGVADEVHVPPSGRVGSIGCIAAWVDESAAWTKEGIAWHVVREPAGKADAMPAAPVADLADERVGTLVKDAAGRFFAAVAARRGLDVKAVRGMNGALFQGGEAVETKLADSVGTLEAAAGRVLELAQERRDAAQKDMNMKLTAVVAALCGLSADATPEAAEVAISALAKDITEATGAKSLAGVAGAVEALKAERDAHAEKAAALAKLEAEMVAREKAEAAAKLGATIDEAVKAGKITPARKAEFSAKAEKFGQEWLDAVVDALPVQGGTRAAAEGIKPSENDVPTVNAELKTALAKFGCTENDYLAAEQAGVV